MRKSVFMAALILSSFAVAFAQRQPGNEYAARIAREAYETAMNGDFNGSLSLINNGIGRCDGFEDAKSCRAILHFNAGYLYERRFQDDLDSAWLNLARANYDRILADYPTDQKALERSVGIMIAKRDFEEASAAIARLMELYPGETYRYMLMRAKALEASGEAYASLREVEKAIDLNPFEEAGWRALVGLYSGNRRNLTIENVREYAYDCSGYGYPVLALEVLQNFIKWGRNEEEITAALVHWANLLTERNLFTPNRLDFIPSPLQWPVEANVQLHLLFYLDTLSNPARLIDELSFWNSSRRIDQDYLSVRPFEVLAKILKSYGDKYRAGNDPAKAEMFYNLAIDAINRHHPQDYEIPIAYFETAGALAELYFLHPGLDPGEAAYKKLTRELFIGKNNAYGSHSYEVIKKYHVTLGIIYARKGVWNTPGADNARFSSKGPSGSRAQTSICHTFIPYWQKATEMFRGRKRGFFNRPAMRRRST